MKFKIVYNRPGWLRVRGGGYTFPKDKEYTPRLEIGAWEHAAHTETHYENGGILVCYEAGIQSLPTALGVESSFFRFILTFTVIA